MSGDLTTETSSEPEEKVEKVKQPKVSPWNLYTVLLSISLAAVVLAILLLLLELSSYHFNFGANRVG